MTRRKKHKPYDPAAAERMRAEREADREMAATLAAQPSTQVNRDGRTGRLTSAIRLNCFNTLLPANGMERAAVDWLDEIVRTAHGENTPERRPDHIRASNDGAPGQNVSDAMLAAALTLAVVVDAMAPAQARMLLALMQPDADLITRWRVTVERHTGETHTHAQAAAVRAACTQLVWIRDNIGRLERAWRERRSEQRAA
jgi:hypothetical protein